MKNLLSIAAVAALLSTIAIADNNINTTGTITAKAVASFSSSASENYHATNSGRFIDASIPLGEITGDVLNDIYVKTNINSAQSVTMGITADNGGKLETPLGDQIPVQYLLGATAFDPTGTALTLTLPADHTGAVALADQFIVRPTITGNEIAGVYTEHLTVVITAG